MLKTCRLDPEFLGCNGGRFILNFPKNDPVTFDVKRIEGRRWEPKLRVWTVPPTMRAWEKLYTLGFSMLEYGGGTKYLEWLAAGCPVTASRLVGEHNPTLFGFQQDGVARLLLRARRMGLFDEPGLGKTHQAIEWAKISSEPKLIIAPKVILGNWQAEIERRCDDMDYTIGQRLSGWAANWNIVNPEFLPKLSLPTDDFDLIVDEAHLFTNVKTRRTKLTLQLAERAKRVLLLTGTPPNQPIRVWPFFMMLGLRQPKEFFPYALRYCAAEQNDFGWDFSGATHLDELRAEMQPFTLRRTKAEVLDDLPEKLYTTILAEPDKKAVAKELSALDDEILTLVSKGHSLSGALGVGAVQRLRVAASIAKVETTAQLVADRLPAKHLVFCEFRESMSAISTRIDALSEGTCVPAEIHGDTRDREAIVQWFTETSDPAVLVCQYQVAGLGLNLQSASTVVIHDLPWTPAQLDQAIDRAHRIGQRDSVHVMTVLSRSRVEGLMLVGLREGRQLTEALYDGLRSTPSLRAPREAEGGGTRVAEEGGNQEHQ